MHQHNPPEELHLERGRIRHAAEGLVSTLPSQAQQTILARLEALQDAADATGFALRLYPLVADLPGSSARRREQRKKLPDEFVEAFAATIAVETSSALSLLKRFMTYGPLGMAHAAASRALVVPASPQARSPGGVAELPASDRDLQRLRSHAGPPPAASADGDGTLQSLSQR